MGKAKKGSEVAPQRGEEGSAAVIEPAGDQGVQTRIVMMNKPKLSTPGARSDDEGANIQWVFKPIARPHPKAQAEKAPGPEANIKWVLEPMVARRGRGRGKVPPSIGSMKIPGKP